MIYKFNEFNEINEGILGSVINNLKQRVGKFFSGIEKGILDKISSLGQKLSNAKTNKERSGIFTNELTTTKGDFQNNMNNATDILSIRKTYKDYFSKVYLMFYSAQEWLKDPNLAPIGVFKDNHKLLSVQKQGDFAAKIDGEINKHLSGKNISESDKKILQDNPKVGQEKKQQPSKTEQKPEQNQQTNKQKTQPEQKQPNQGTEQKKENKISKFREFLLEAENPPTSATETNYDQLKKDLIGEYDTLIEDSIKSAEGVFLNNKADNNSNQQQVQQFVKTMAPTFKGN